jgi:hypothetical protein
MSHHIDRRDFMRLAAIAGITYASGLRAGPYGAKDASSATKPGDDFYFVQLSDTHWGYEGPINPDARGTLPKAIAAVNALAEAPDFIVFTGDLTHLTLNPKERRARLTQVREQLAGLKVREIHVLPGEHDASADHGEAFQEIFGPTHYAFDHKGIHFVALDNVSDPNGAIGDEQLAWFAGVLETLPKDQPLVVLTHRPLFDLYPAWGWATADGARAVELMMPFRNATVFYGHIHQENTHMTGHIGHHAAKSLIFPMPAPGSQPDHKPLPWDPAHPYRGLGWRDVEAELDAARFAIEEHPIAAA